MGDGEVDVFISYKREDRARIDRIEAALTVLDLKVWFDWRLTPGLNFSEEIDAAARNAKAMVVCWSPAAVQSDWVQREATIGFGRDALAPVMLERCTPPEKFSALQAPDLSGWTGALDDRNWQRVLARIGDLIGDRELARNARLRAGGQKQELVGLTRQLLVGRARSGERPYFYEEAQEALTLLADTRRISLGEFDQPTLWGALDEIAEQNRGRREPPLPCLVVNEATGRPSSGYFRKHAFLADPNSALATEVFKDHLLRVRTYGWPMDD